MNSNSREWITILINPATVLRYSALIIVLLVAASVIGRIFPHIPGHWSRYFIEVVYLDREESIPTLFTLIQWLCTSILLGFIGFVAATRRQLSAPWICLSVIFLFLAIDEFTQFHEYLMGYVPMFFDATGIFFFSWIIPYSLIVVVLIIVFFRFYIGLPVRIRLLFLFSAIIFFAGSFGLEMLGGRVVSSRGFGDEEYQLIYVTIEETLEMVGLAIFMYALCCYLREEMRINQIRFLTDDNIDN